MPRPVRDLIVAYGTKPLPDLVDRKAAWVAREAPQRRIRIQNGDFAQDLRALSCPFGLVRRLTPAGKNGRWSYRKS
jgi:hypothetical protein